MRHPPILAPKVCLLICLILLAPMLTSSATRAQVTVEDLLGTWAWVESAGGFVGETLTPDDPEWVPVQWKFESDGKLRISVNGVLVEATYELSKPDSGPQTLSVVLGAMEENLPLLMRADSYTIEIPMPGLLMLDEGCCDRYQHTFAFDASGLLPVDETSVSETKSRWTNSPH